MSVWKNLFTAVKGHVNEAAEAAEDGQILTILDQQIREANTAIGKARDERARMAGNRRLKEKSIAEINGEIERLTSGAKSAKEGGDMDLAREAIERIIKLQEQQGADQKLFDQYKVSEEKMEASIRQSAAKIESLKRQVESAKANEALLAAQRASSMSSAASNSKLAGAVDSLDRLEKRQAAQSAALEAADELAEQESGADLDARLAKLAGGGGKSAEDMLASL
ncbi:MAG: PspA/IM30 family protein [Opitutaceae bacterium]|jgi:phage shock protein A|nr:PspA/IM30 family protein [Opitutaceae bacterium]